MAELHTLKPDYTDQIMDELRGKRFVAVSFDKASGTFKHYHNGLTPQEVVFIAQHMINREMRLTTAEDEEYAE